MERLTIRAGQTGTNFLETTNLVYGGTPFLRESESGTLPFVKIRLVDAAGGKHHLRGI